MDYYFSIFILNLKLNWKTVIAINLSFAGIYIAVSKGSLTGFSMDHLKGNIFPFFWLGRIYFIDHEAIYYSSIVGLALIVIGIVIQQMKSKKKVDA